MKTVYVVMASLFLSQWLIVPFFSRSHKYREGFFVGIMAAVFLFVIYWGLSL